MPTWDLSSEACTDETASDVRVEGASDDRVEGASDVCVEGRNWVPLPEPGAGDAPSLLSHVPASQETIKYRGTSLINKRQLPRTALGMGLR